MIDSALKFTTLQERKYKKKMNLRITSMIINRSSTLLSLRSLSLHLPTPILKPSLLNSTIITTRGFSSSNSQQWKSSKPKNKPCRYKLSTHKGASKRFFVTGNGQFKRVCCPLSSSLPTSLTLTLSSSQITVPSR